MGGKQARQHMEHAQMIITTWVQEDRGGGKARQGKARQGKARQGKVRQGKAGIPPHPKFWRGKLVKSERTDKKNQTEKKFL